MPTLIDTHEVVYAHLAASSLLTAAVTAGSVRHLYGPPGVPPNWTITKAVMFLGDGGASNENIPMEYETFQFRCYAPSLPEAAALYRTLVVALLHLDPVRVPVTGGYALLRLAERISGPHLDIEPQTLWPYSMSTWRLHIGQYLLS